MTTTEKEPFIQYHDPEEVEHSGKKKLMTFRVLRAHKLRVRKGPAIILKIGDLVSLHDLYSIDSGFYTGRLDPVQPAIPDNAEYTTRRDFTIVNPEGEYQTIALGMTVRLNRSEALELMKKRCIKPVNESDFYII